MIKVDRPKGSVPQGLLAAARSELRNNRTANAENNKLKFKAYSAPKVKDKLAGLFGRKCMFCESLLAGSQPGDVEHYRPKGKVVLHPKPEIGDHSVPGYFWLAAKWPNLLLSCADCNRPRTQPDFDNRKRVIGKANYFPLADESARATGPWAILAEEPLLLNPCLDDPSAHLVFHEDGRIEPAIIDGTPSAKGQASIHFLGLARAELLQMRARHGRTVMAAIRHTVVALEGGRDPGADLDDLVTLLSPKEAYVAYTRMLVSKHMGSYLSALGISIT